MPWFASTRCAVWATACALCEQARLQSARAITDQPFADAGLGLCTLALSLFDTRDELRRISLFLQAEEIARDFKPSESLDSLPRQYAGGEMSYSLYSAEGELLQASSNLASPRRLRPAQPEDELALFRLKHRSGYVVSVSVTLPSGEILMVAKRDQRERELIGALLQTRMWRSLLFVATSVCGGSVVDRLAYSLDLASGTTSGKSGCDARPCSPRTALASH